MYLKVVPMVSSYSIAQSCLLRQEHLELTQSQKKQKKAGRLTRKKKRLSQRRKKVVCLLLK
jgi:hypothetical protein